MRSTGWPLGLLALWLSLAAPAPGAAQLMDGQTLYDHCTAEGYASDAEICAAFIAGVLDADRHAAAEKSAISLSACVPPAVRIERLRAVVRDFLLAHPEQRRRPAVELVGAALRAAFRCPV